MENTPMKKDKPRLTPEQMFNIYQECLAPGAPVKQILERYGLKPWDLVTIRRKVKEAAMEALSSPRRRGRKKSSVSIEEHQKVVKELQESKEALSAVGHEFALLKKRVN